MRSGAVLHLVAEQFAGAHREGAVFEQRAVQQDQFAGRVRSARRAAARVAMGVIERALATAPIRAEGSRLGMFIADIRTSCDWNADC